MASWVWVWAPHGLEAPPSPSSAGAAGAGDVHRDEAMTQSSDPEAGAVQPGRLQVAGVEICESCAGCEKLLTRKFPSFQQRRCGWAAANQGTRGGRLELRRLASARAAVGGEVGRIQRAKGDTHG
jgi:hypothetical protein